jgi:spore germination protein YaaH
VGFLPNWLIEDASQAIDLDLLSVLAFHGIEASSNGRLVSNKSGDVPEGWAALDDPAFLELKERAQAAGVKVVVTIQRMGWTEGTLERTRALLGSGRDRRALAGRIAAFVVERGFDGVNLDVEPVPEQLAEQYVAFVREVRAALDRVDPALHLSVDVLPSLSGYDLAGLTGEGAADLAVIMGYNLRTAGSGTTGSTAPLHDEASGDLATSVAAALEVAPADRLVLGLPWFGMAWSAASDEPGAETLRGDDVEGPASPPYAEAVPLAAQWGRRYDARQASAWVAYPDRRCSNCEATWRQLWYDDPDSFGAKVDHALANGLAGVGVWALGQEGGRDEMWTALRQRLLPMADDTPPAGSASLDPETVTGDREGLDVVDGSAELLLFAQDDPDGSGLALARVGLDDEIGEDGSLVSGMDYPAVDRVTFPLGDPGTGGTGDDGARAIHVQWRDLAGNWSPPLVIEAWVTDPAGAPTPDDL